MDNIQGGFDGPYVRDMGPHSAKIVFTTRVPIVCNVAYGTDANYGRLLLMAMTGPLTDHEISLLGLEPDTVYHYRITVTDIASNVYQSDDLTFITAETTNQEKPSRENVASADAGARVIAVSSNWGGGDLDSSFGANMAIDGNGSTEWSSDGDGNDAWIEIELAKTYELSIIGFWTRTMGNSAQIFSFKVVTDEGTQLGPYYLHDAATVYYFDVQTRAKRLRFEVETSSGGNTGAVEIEAYVR
ncbi:discoidin domain-containing protein [Chloroflexota bacterium]